MSDVSIRSLLLEFFDSNGASHIQEMHIEILRQKPGTPEHTIRARLSEAVIVKDVLNLPFGEIRSVIIKIQHHCTSDRKRYGKMEDVPIRHEYCVIFKKPIVATLPCGFEPGIKKESRQ